MASYDTSSRKFQGATSALQPTGFALWLAVAGVGLMVGEAAYQVIPNERTGTGGPAAWLWLVVAAALALGVAVTCWRSATRSGRPLAFGLVTLALLLGIGTWRNWRVRADPITATGEATAAAIASRDRVLATAVAGASHTARIALQRTGGVRPGEAPARGDRSTAAWWNWGWWASPATRWWPSPVRSGSRRSPRVIRLRWFARRSVACWW